VCPLRVRMRVNVSVSVRVRSRSRSTFSVRVGLGLGLGAPLEKGSETACLDGTGTMTQRIPHKLAHSVILATKITWKTGLEALNVLRLETPND